MVKQVLEKRFRQSMNADAELWGMKLHNNPLAHQTTPADFILSYEKGPILQLHLVECKQVTCDEAGKGRLAHKRLKQMHDLLAFSHKHQNHYSWFCITFYTGNWEDSDTYLIPAPAVYEAILNGSKVSFNRDDMKRLFKAYELTTEHKVFKLWRLK